MANEKAKVNVEKDGYNHRRSCPQDKKQAELWQQRANDNEWSVTFGGKPSYIVNDPNNEGPEM